MPELLFVAARALHYAATVQFAGLFLFLRFIAAPAYAGFSQPGGGALRWWLYRIAWASLIVALLSGAAWVMLVGAMMGGEAPLLPSRETLALMLGETRFGHLAELRAGIVVAALAVLAVPRLDPRWRDGVLLALAAALLGSIAWWGHGAALPGRAGAIHLAADVVHLLAAGAWLGALLPLALLFAAARRAAGRDGALIARRATQRFALLGYGAVGALLLSGLVNLWFLAGSVAALTGTLYGRLLLGKIGLFLLMLVFAAINRCQIAPRLWRRSEDWPAVVALGRNSLFELALGIGILLIVAMLGLLAPALPYIAP